MTNFEVPEGWCVQAFRFTLDPTGDQARALARHFGARCKAYNWTVATLKADIEAWHAAGVETAKPSLRVLRKRWNTVKDDVCVNAETGAVWWPERSKEAHADGITGAVDAYWNWQSSRAGKRAGERVGFPRFKRKGRDSDRVCFTTGAMRVEPDRRHLTLPVIGTVRTHENTRRIERLIRAGRARVLAISVRRNGIRLDASVRALVQRPQRPSVALAGSRVGVDVGVRRLATVPTADGVVIEQVENPRPLDAVLGELRQLCRSAPHQGDDNASINLARYEDTVSVVGPVGAAVKRGADRKTRPGRAGGREARKGTGHPAGEQPRDGVRVA